MGIIGGKFWQGSQYLYHHRWCFLLSIYKEICMFINLV